MRRFLKCFWCVGFVFLVCSSVLYGQDVERHRNENLAKSYGKVKKKDILFLPRKDYLAGEAVVIKYLKGRYEFDVGNSALFFDISIRLQVLEEGARLDTVLVPYYLPFDTYSPDLTRKGAVLCTLVGGKVVKQPLVMRFEPVEGNTALAVLHFDFLKGWKALPKGAILDIKYTMRYNSFKGNQLKSVTFPWYFQDYNYPVIYNRFILNHWASIPYYPGYGGYLPKPEPESYFYLPTTAGYQYFGVRMRHVVWDMYNLPAYKGQGSDKPVCFLFVGFDGKVPR